MQASPVEYKAKREVIQDFEYDLKEPDLDAIDSVQLIFIEPDQQKEPNFMIGIYPRQDIIQSDKFRTFLCDYEMFNWQNLKHDMIINYIRYKIRYDTYTNYLLTILGSDMTFFGNAYSDYYEDNSRVENAMINKLIFSKNDSPIARDIAYKRDSLGLPYKYFAYPLFIEQVERTVFSGFFSPQILGSRTRYVVINLNNRYLNSTHYTFLFIDHKDQSIEYYDPYGGRGNIFASEFIYGALQKMYAGYKINEFWKNKGIQFIEEIEEDIYGFCVIWGHIILHLKLLNMNMSVGDIESEFIKECGRRNLALYEVMLNYAYMMSRIIPREPENFVMLDNILNFG